MLASGAMCLLGDQNRLLSELIDLVSLRCQKFWLLSPCVPHSAVKNKTCIPIRGVIDPDK